MATTCCVPGEVITPNVVIVKGLNIPWPHQQPWIAPARKSPGAVPVNRDMRWLLFVILVVALIWVAIQMWQTFFNGNF